MSKELPGEWGELLGPKGIHSYRDMAAATDIAAGTMHRLVTGKATSTETVNAVADKLFDGDRDLVWRLRGSQRRDHGDWNLPAEASLLTEAQRSAVLAVIQAMVPVEQEGGGERADSSAATKSPEVGPAEQPTTTRRPRGEKTHRTVTKLSERGSKVQDPEPRVAKKRTSKKRQD